MSDISEMGRSVDEIAIRAADEVHAVNQQITLARGGGNGEGTFESQQEALKRQLAEAIAQVNEVKARLQSAQVQLDHALEALDEALEEGGEMMATLG